MEALTLIWKSDTRRLNLRCQFIGLITVFWITCPLISRVSPLFLRSLPLGRALHFHDGSVRVWLYSRRRSLPVFDPNGRRTPHRRQQATRWRYQNTSGCIRVGHITNGHAWSSSVLLRTMGVRYTLHGDHGVAGGRLDIGHRDDEQTTPATEQDRPRRTGPLVSN